MDYSILYDTTKFIKSSIDEVIETLLVAVLLVILVVYIFLQDVRSTIIPSLTIPVSLIGTFAFLLALGYTLNTVTLFGLILAIGVVVDDAIVVLENVQRLMDERAWPQEATKGNAGSLRPYCSYYTRFTCCFCSSCIFTWYNRYFIQAVCSNNFNFSSYFISQCADLKSALCSC